MIKYYAVVNGIRYNILLFDQDRIKGHVPFAVINKNANNCSIYYNENDYSEEELIKSGYAVIDMIEEVDILGSRHILYCK